MRTDDQIILKQRASRLAAPPASDTSSDTTSAVFFSIGSEKYIIEARSVLEVARLKDYTAVPGTPPFIMGVTNIRGTILALVDLRKFFGLPPRGLTDLTRIIVLGGDRMEFGILAEKVEHSSALDQSAVLAIPDSISPFTRKYIKGVTGDAAIFLDAAALLHDERLYIEMQSTQ